MRFERIRQQNCAYYQECHIMHFGLNDHLSTSVTSLVRAPHRHLEVTDSNPVEGLNFLRLTCAIAKIAFKTARIIASLDFISEVQYMIHFTHHFVCKLTIDFPRGSIESVFKPSLRRRERNLRNFTCKWFDLL